MQCGNRLVEPRETLLVESRNETLWKPAISPFVGFDLHFGDKGWRSFRVLPLFGVVVRVKLGREPCIARLHVILCILPRDVVLACVSSPKTGQALWGECQDCAPCLTRRCQVQSRPFTTTHTPWLA